MELPEDDFILVSVINTKLRDFYADLFDLAQSEGIDPNTLAGRISKAGYRYDGGENKLVLK